jgi:uncharacterized protein
VNAELLPWLVAGVFTVAALYASVGHAGASGYIAVMTLLGLAPAFVKPAALALNVLVAAIAFTQFARAGHFRWALFWPFALLAPPMAYLGGWLQLPTQWFQWLIGAVLLYAAVTLQMPPRASSAEPRAPSVAVALVVGAALGLLSGLTGTGGGIFLTPLLLLAGWAAPKNAAAVSALFILVNSCAGLAGHVAATRELPVMVWPLLAAAALGGAIGATLGAGRFDATLIRRLLAAVLLIAGLKLLLS